MLITFWVILTYSFQMAAILVLFFICSPAHTQNNRNFIFGVNIQIYSCYMLITFLAHLVYQPKSLIQSCFVHHCRWHCPALVSVSSVHISPWHMVRHRNLILGTHMHICPPCMHIKYLMILTCSF